MGSMFNFYGGTVRCLRSEQRTIKKIFFWLCENFGTRLGENSRKILSNFSKIT